MRTICPDCGHKNIQGSDVCESCSGPLAHLPAASTEAGLPAKIRSGVIAGIPPRRAYTVDADAPLTDVVLLMRGRRIGSVMVTEGGRMRGIIMERDLLFGVAGLRDPRRLKAREVMYERPIVMEHDDPVCYAFHHMTVGGYRHMPVLLKDGSVGLLTTHDLLKYLAPPVLPAAGKRRRK